MTCRPVAFFDPTAADYDDLDATVDAIMAVVLEWRPAVGQAMEEGYEPPAPRSVGISPLSAPPRLSRCWATSDAHPGPWEQHHRSDL